MDKREEVMQGINYVVNHALSVEIFYWAFLMIKEKPEMEITDALREATLEWDK